MNITFHDWDPNPATTFLEAGDQLSGKVTFEATHDSNWSALGVSEGFALSGDLEARSTVLKTHTLEREVTLKKGERRTYDFSIRTGAAVTYLGTTAAAEPTLTGFAVRAPGSSRALRRLMGEKKIIQEEVKLNVRDREGYGIKAAPVILAVQRNNGWMIGLLIATVILGWLGIKFDFAWMLAGVLGVAYGALFILRAVLIEKIGALTLTAIPTGGNNWMARVEMEETGSRVHGISAGYVVTEELTDRRTDKVLSEESTLYESPVDERTGDGVLYRFEHQFPTGVPPSRNYGDLAINWRYHVIVRAAYGMSFTYRAPLNAEAGVQALSLAGRTPQTESRTPSKSLGDHRARARRDWESF